MAGCFGSCLVAKGKMKSMYVVATLGPVAYLLVSVVLLKPWGLLGVATAFSISSFVSMATEYSFLRYYFQFRLENKNKILIAVTILWVVFAVLVGLDKMSILWKIAVTGFALPWLCLSLSVHERKFIFEKIKKMISR